MKRLFLSVITILTSLTLQAKPVDPSLLLQAAQRILQRADVVDVTPDSFNGCRLYVGADGMGFVLLSDDDCVRPLLGYSLINPFPVEAMPTVSEVAPLLKTRWNQNNGYNNQCPFDSAANARCYTGCVATAAAQVMKYWNHPEVGRGSHSYTHPKYGTLSAGFDTTHYQWSRMSNAISAGTTPERIAAMAQLMAHVGIAVDMTYGPSGGHAFVLDGRDSMGLYHFNWGWGGSGNGYFTLDSLAPMSNASFSQLNSAIFHVYPVTVNETTATLIGVSSDPSRGTVSGSGTYSVDTMRVLLLATANPGYRFDHWTSGNPANPIITSPTNDISDTAVFVPIHRDSVGYCRNNGIAYKNLTDEDSVEWGIRIPHEYLEGKQRLREVHFWTYEASGPYHLRLYRGEQPSADNLFYTDSLMATGYGMNIYTIPADLAIDFADTTPLWVTIYAKGSPFPISYSHYTGTPDGSWVRYNGIWQPMYLAKHVYGSWMLRALLDPSTHVGVAEVESEPIDVTVMGRTVYVRADGSVALYDIQGRRLAIDTDGLRCTLPSAGIYVVRCGASGKKIIVY